MNRVRKKMTENNNTDIVVVTTDIADLAMMGFGSVANCQAVCDALNVFYPNTTLRVLRSQHDLDYLVVHKPDLVIAGIKYLMFTDQPISKSDENKIWLADFLDLYGIKYTGSQGAAIRLDFDKMMAKKLIRQNHLPTADYFTAMPGKYHAGQNLPVDYPLFVKPMFESDSKGIDQDSYVTDFNGFHRKVEAIYETYRQPALAEAYLGGREFTVAIIEDREKPDLKVMPVEIVLDQPAENSHFLDKAIKESNRERLVPIQDTSVYQKVAELARRSFNALGARDFGRIDIKMDCDGQPFFLEANLLPGMNPEWSYFPAACRINEKIDYYEMIRQLAEPAMRR